MTFYHRTPDTRVGSNGFLASERSINPVRVFDFNTVVPASSRQTTARKSSTICYPRRLIARNTGLPTLDFLMSQTPSPYSRPVQAVPPETGSSRNTVAIVAIISVTLLLMCSGLVGLGFYAVDRLAEQISELSDDFEEWDEEEAVSALEFALEQNAVIQERVGQIEQIEHQADLTFHDNADVEDYYYRVKGSSGDALVVVQFDYDDQRWFKNVELVEGNGIEDSRMTLQARNAPYDSQWSKRVYDILAANDGSLAQSLNIGTVRWIIYDYEKSSQRSVDKELLFEIHGESGAVSVVARFEDTKYIVVRSLQIVDDDGAQQQTIFTADPAAQSTITPGTVP